MMNEKGAGPALRILERSLPVKNEFLLLHDAKGMVLIPLNQLHVIFDSPSGARVVLIGGMSIVVQETLQMIMNSLSVPK